MALDSEGCVYSCITQSNTDSKIFSMYLKELVKALDKKDKNWRATHVLLLDGAKYVVSVLILIIFRY